MFFRTAFFLISIFIFAGSGAAEIYECDGVWTDIPCDGTVGKVIKEAKGPASGETLKKESDGRTRKWLHDLDMKAFRARREHEVDVSTATAHAVCTDLQSSEFKKCRDAIDKTEAEINKLVADVRVSGSDRKPGQNNLGSEGGRNSGTTVIINRDDRWRDGYPGPHRKDRYKKKPEGNKNVKGKKNRPETLPGRPVKPVKNKSVRMNGDVVSGVGVSRRK